MAGALRARPTDGPSTDATATTTPSGGWWFLGALSAGAGVIHLAMAPAHNASTAEMVGFAAVGWAQIALGLVLAFRPSRPALAAGGGVALVALGAWAWSRTVGLPIGAHAGVPEPIGTADGICVALQLVFVAAALGVLAVPDGAGRRVPELASAIGAVAVLGLATVGLAAPGAHGHGDAELAGHSHAAGDDHGHAADAAHAAGDGHGHDTTDVELAAVHGHDDTVAVVTDDGHAHGSSTSSSGHGSGSSSTSDHAHGAGSSSTGDAHDHGDGSPTSTAHDHGTGSTTPGGGHDHGSTDPSQVVVDYGPANRCDLRFNPASYYRDATIAGADFVNGPTAAEIAAPHTMSEIDTARLIQQLASGSDADYFAFLAGGHQHGGGATTHDAHNGPQSWRALTDPATCNALAVQLATARSVALSMPTAADAIARGYHRVTPYVMGIGAHYINDDLVDGTFEVDRPEMILYDGNDPNAHVVGLSYQVIHDGDDEPSVGFVGRNDRYHRHTTLCFKGGITIGDSNMSKEQCEALGGEINDGSNQWMSHAWIVPGCESPWGVFSQVNPILDIDVGNASGSRTDCSASAAYHRYDLRPPK